jgi:hypothetical protein
MSAKQDSLGSENLEQRQIRAAKNQSLFREVNERIEELGPPSTRLEFVCECTLDGCSKVIDVTRQEYEIVRSDANSFLVSPGHVVLEVEVVVEGTERFEVVQKVGAGKRIAERLNPRQREGRLKSAPEPSARASQ